MNNEEIKDEEMYAENNNDVDVNKKNSEHYESVMRDASVNLDSYWDSNNIVVRLVLIGLAIFIVVGVLLVFIFS